MLSLNTEVGRRTALNRLYDRYANDSDFAHMLAHTNGVVPGDGPTRPRLVFVGEAPGGNEDKHRKPFIGASGRLLNEMLESVGMLRSEVFITNTVKIRPVIAREQTRTAKARQKGTYITISNRPPTEAEKLASVPYLRREMAYLGNAPIVILGKHARGAMGHLANPGTPLGDPSLNMKLGEWTTALGVPMLPLHHPAYGIYQEANRPMMFEMFRAVLHAPQ